MAFIHCNNELCQWCQDDFWSKNGYNPLREDLMKWLRDCLFQDTVRLGGCDGDPPCDLPATEFVARELERIAKTIRNMRFKTYEDFVENKDNFVCPECGNKSWSID